MAQYNPASKAMLPFESQSNTANKRKRSMDSRILDEKAYRGKRTKDANTETRPRRSARLAPFRFFELPMELRDMVYEEIWMSTPPIQLCPKPFSHSEDSQYLKHHRTSRNFRGSMQQGLPKWLLTNKQILHEGLEKLCFDGRWGISLATKQPLPPLLRSHFPRRLAITGIRYSANPTSVHLNTEAVTFQLHEEIGSIHDLYKNTTAAHKVKALYLDIGVKYPRAHLSAELFKLDISPFGAVLGDCFPEIRKLQIRFTTRLDTRYIAEDALPALQRDYGYEIGHLAGLIAGPDPDVRPESIRMHLANVDKLSFWNWTTYGI
ncbi:hypothetical protein P280DRAFT_503754 [Massarina eburnea CBS 473.64]|uniref:F-box domain-containing protein n=1 Tax=Massarina eburnea CBS 473.64 TaxID=1395130 RepID=A0A6A6SEY3_9PLEO|nr:hypothetical protein P280DRAFT_503754 [Massarina eburnea CBS 473.64]